MEEEIRQLVKKHYKRAKLYDVDCDLDDTVTIVIDGVNPSYVARRILEMFPEKKWVKVKSSSKKIQLYSREALNKCKAMGWLWD